MKIALCLFGIVGGIAGKSGQGGDVDFKLCYDHYKKYIIDPNDTDVFIHTWSVQHQDALQELYKPKKAKYEPQISFKEPNYRLKSRWYSHNQVLLLKHKYERKTNVEYDFVIVGRLDLMWFEKVNFKKLNPEKFYVSYTNDYPWIKGGQSSDIYTKIHNPGRILDLWFIASPELMERTKDIYGLIDRAKGRVDIHRFLWEYFMNRGNLEFKYYRGFEYELYRWKVMGCYR
jgi:hypothetical protein